MSLSSTDESADESNMLSSSDESKRLVSSLDETKKLVSSKDGTVLIFGDPLDAAGKHFHNGPTCKRRGLRVQFGCLACALNVCMF
jgi:hypothetical protein